MAEDRSQHGYRLMRSARMDALSDGVYAIAITLLVLDLAVPGVTGERLLDALADDWPAYLAYVVSFASIGAAWINHTTISECLDGANAALLRINLLGLLFVAVLPFPTRLLGEFIGDVDAERVAVVYYGTSLFLVMLMLYVMWQYALHAGLISSELPDEDVEELTKRLRPGLGGYVAMIVVGLFFPKAAVVGYLLLALLLISPVHHIRSDIRRAQSGRDDS